MAKPPDAPDATAQTLITRAAGAVEAGDSAQAEAVCRQLILEGRAGSGAVAWNVVGRAMLRAGRPALAAQAFEAALAADPYFKPARKNLALARAFDGASHDRAGAGATGAAGRFLVIRAFGAGFWADVDHVVSMLLLAEITNRTPLVHWSGASRYSTPTSSTPTSSTPTSSDPTSSDPTSNAWDEFFEPVSRVTIADVLGRGFAYYPGGWDDSNVTGGPVDKKSPAWRATPAMELLNRPEAVVVSDWHTPLPCILAWAPPEHRLRGQGLQAPLVPPAGAYRDLVAKYIRVKPEIARLAEEFWARHCAGRKMLGVHLRGSDKVTEFAEIAQVLRQYPAEIDRRLGALGADAGLLIITDSEPLLAEYRKRYGQRVLTPEGVRTDRGVGLHFSGEKDRRRLGVEVIRDVLLAAKCDQFVGLGWSNVTNFVHYFKEWKSGDWIALGPPGHAHFAIVPPG